MTMIFFQEQINSGAYYKTVMFFIQIYYFLPNILVLDLKKIPKPYNKLNLVI